ncbi:hypothetical protein I317_04485 [Kwoniella heveanensis CBS 569]|nr:hypothetical protein I317_04485 [Kwoniella heveanensis CBS 569]
MTFLQEIGVADPRPGADTQFSTQYKQFDKDPNFSQLDYSRQGRTESITVTANTDCVRPCNRGGPHVTDDIGTGTGTIASGVRQISSSYCPVEDSSNFAPALDQALDATDFSLKSGTGTGAGSGTLVPAGSLAPCQFNAS